ncbi:MAG: DNA polymerase I [Alphaproteobacteria bacterium]|nr:DNA polymerase I [Alphaproteobacteria bacterium]
MSKSPKHVFLVDGSGFIFRAYHALPPLTRPDGTPVGAVFGFTQMLMKLISDTDADHVAVIFDTDRISFRNDIYPDYKANRPEPPEDLIPQFALIREATEAFNLPAVELKGFEADDLIATYARLAREAGAEVTIVSSDKDLMQLVEEKVTMYDSLKNRMIGCKEVEEKFGVGPEKVVEVQALAGDSTDNVPGVPGIGVKTAAELIREYGNLENLLAHADAIKQPKRRERLKENADLARVSRELVTLKRDVDVPVALASFRVRPPAPDKLLKFVKKQGFRSLAARLEAAAGEAVPAQAATKLQGKPAAYELVQSLDRLKGWIAAAREAGVVAFDTETTGLDATQAELVGFSLAVEANQACYVPLAHRSPVTGRLDLDGEGNGDGEILPSQIAFQEAFKLLKPLLEDEGVLKVGQHLKYDMVVMGRYGIRIAPFDDTMLLSYVLEGGLHGHGMDELARLHLGVETVKFKDVAGSGKGQLRFDEVALDRACEYAAEDADITGKLYRLLKPRLAETRVTTVYETIERPLVPVLVEMERAGIRVDKTRLRKLSAEFAERMEGLEKKIHKEAGHAFNIASPKQLGEVLFDEMGLEGGRRGKTGAYGTAAGLLEELAAEGHALPALVLEWRQTAKLKSTYSDALAEQIHPETGRVHTSYAMAATSTGRLASSDPNLQNIPVRTEEGRKIRAAFVAEKGMKLLSADYSQIELRLLAEVAGIETLREAFHEGLDIHALTASQVFGVPIEGMDPMVRRQAKAINFGIIYGISPFGLARQLGIPQKEAAAYIDAYFERYPGIRDYMEKTKAFARDHGFVTTLFGRRCFVPGIKDKNPARRNFSERAAINAPLQGTAADIIKRAMIRMPDALKEAKLSARMLLQVHDELVFEVPNAEIEAASALVAKVMEGAAQPKLTLAVPLVVDTNAATNWSDAH